LTSSEVSRGRKYLVRHPRFAPTGRSASPFRGWDGTGARPQLMSASPSHTDPARAGSSPTRAATLPQNDEIATDGKKRPGSSSRSSRTASSQSLILGNAIGKGFAERQASAGTGIPRAGPAINLQPTRPAGKPATALGNPDLRTRHRMGTS